MSKGILSLKNTWQSFLPLQLFGRIDVHKGHSCPISRLDVFDLIYRGGYKAISSGIIKLWYDQVSKVRKGIPGPK